MKARIFLGVVLLIFDFTLLPWILRFIPLFLEYNIDTPKLWLNEFTLLGFKQVIVEEQIRMLWIVVQGFIFIVFVTLFWRDVPKRKYKLSNGIGGPEAAGRGEHGTSRWQTDKELDQSSTVWQTDKPLTNGGVVLGMESKKKAIHKVWLDTEDTHTLVIGATRSGKSRKMIFPTIWSLAHAGESMILSDPKGELYKRSQKYLKQNGYSVVLLDFRNPKRGNHWNPMSGVNRAVHDGDLSKASEVAWDIAQMICPPPARGEPIWSNGSQSALAATILAVATESRSEDEKHLGSVYQMLIELGSPVETQMFSYVPLNLFFESLPLGHVAKSAYGVAKLAPDKQRGSFFTGAASELKLWSDPNIAFLTSKQDHVMESFGTQKTAVFLVIPDETTTRHILASLYINQAYQSLIKVATDTGKDRLPIRTNFLLDEFGNLPRISDFDKKITVSAGRGIRFTLIIQGIDQLKTHYRESMKTITGNCHTWIYLATRDNDTADEISKMTGRYTIESENLSSTVMPKSNSRGFSSSTTGRALLDSSEVLRFPKDKSLILRQYQFPAILPMPDLSEWQADRDFAEDDSSTEKQITSVSYFVPTVEPPKKNKGKKRSDEKLQELLEDLL